MRHERKKKKTCWSREKREKKSQRWALIYSFSKSIPILPDEKKQKQRRKKKKRRWWRGDTEAWPDRQASTVGSFLSPYTHAWLNLFFFSFLLSCCWARWCCTIFDYYGERLRPIRCADKQYRQTQYQHFDILFHCRLVLSLLRLRPCRHNISAIYKLSISIFRWCVCVC